MVDSKPTRYSEPYLFEKYVLAVLSALSQKSGKEFLVAYRDSKSMIMLDGLAPNGIGDISGLTVVEVKMNLRNIDRFLLTSTRIVHAIPDVKNILFIIGERYKHYRYLDNEMRDFEKRYKIHIIIWDNSKINEIAKQFPEISFQYQGKNVTEALKIYEKSPYNKNINEYTKTLSNAFTQNELVLFLGAGISCPVDGNGNGLPAWNSLIKRLINKFIKDNYYGKYDPDILNKYLEPKLNGFSSITIGRFIEKGFDKKFYRSLRESLYNGYGKKIEPNSTLNSISKLCIPPRGKIGIAAIVTYNYDDLLEYYFKNLDIKHKTIIKGNDFPLSDEIPVYHVHGYLPQEGELNEENEKSIIFGEGEYHHQYVDSYSWQNLTQINLLREKTALFIGLSMKDPNLRRLLEISNKFSIKPKHYVLLPDHWKSEDEEMANIFRSMEESTFEELGVNVIWYRDHSEIDLILNKIKIYS